MIRRYTSPYRPSEWMCLESLWSAWNDLLTINCFSATSGAKQEEEGKGTTMFFCNHTAQRPFDKDVVAVMLRHAVSVVDQLRTVLFEEGWA